MAVAAVQGRPLADALLEEGKRRYADERGKTKNQIATQMTTTQKIDYEKIFWLFAGDNKYRPDMLQPFKRAGYYFSTDAYSMIIMQETLAELPFQKQERPEAEKILPAEPMYEVEITVDDIDRQLVPDIIDEMEEEEKEVKCKDCGGDGSQECDLGHDHECDVCSGDGSYTDTIEKPTGRKVADNNKNFRMLSVGFKYKELRRLVDACKMMGVERIKKTNGTDRSGNFFVCGDVKILVMPAYIAEECEGVVNIEV